MTPRGFYVYDPGLKLLARLKALGPRIRAQGGLEEVGEFPSLTDILRDVVGRVERMLEEEQRREIVRIP
jgi:hypothetical protein